MDLNLTDYLENAQRAETTMDLWRLAKRFFKQHGIERISYHHKTELGDQLVAHDGFPSEWVCGYLEQRLILVDPIPEFAQISTQPFLWSDVPRLMKLSHEQKMYFEMMKKAKLGDGLALQVFGPGFRNGYVGLGFGEHGTPPANRSQIAELQIAAQMGHARYCELTPLVQGQVELTAREREALNWVARGKSNSVIADIMGVSRHTVDTMLRRIYDKLNVTDRTSAAITGLGAGLIQIPRAL